VHELQRTINRTYQRHR